MSLPSAESGSTILESKIVKIATRRLAYTTHFHFEATKEHHLHHDEMRPRVKNNVNLRLSLWAEMRRTSRPAATVLPLPWLARRPKASQQQPQGCPVPQKERCLAWLALQATLKQGVLVGVQTTAQPDINQKATGSQTFPKGWFNLLVPALTIGQNLLGKSTNIKGP